MPINSQHPEFKSRLDQWVRCRDVIEGSDAVKAKGEKYLPKLTGQTNAEYAAYKKRALFFSVAGRSLSGLVGMMTRRQPTLTYDEDMESYFTDSRHGFMSFNELLKETANEVLMIGRLFILIDWPVAGGESYITTYTAGNIINWSVNDDGIIEWVVIQEYVIDDSSGDQFEQATVVQYRHLKLVDGVYSVDIYNDKGEITSSTTPRVAGGTLDKIPGVFVTPQGISTELDKPPILDIVDVNLSQYMTSADLEHGRHYTALPTPVVSGVNSDTKLKIGSSTAWAIPEKAKAYYLEFLGQGLASLERAMTEKTAQMAQFSTRLMDTSTRGSEAADTVRLRHSAEAATLSGVAEAIESAMNTIYTMVAEFEGYEEPSIQLNKDFLDTRLTHSELKELTQSYIEGAIDEDTYFYNLYRGELVPVDKESFDSKPVGDGSNDSSQNSPEE